MSVLQSKSCIARQAGSSVTVEGLAKRIGLHALVVAQVVPIKALHTQNSTHVVAHAVSHSRSRDNRREFTAIVSVQDKAFVAGLAYSRSEVEGLAEVIDFLALGRCIKEVTCDALGAKLSVWVGLIAVG